MREYQSTEICGLSKRFDKMFEFFGIRGNRILLVVVMVSIPTIRSRLQRIPLRCLAQKTIHRLS